jgi:hypothetical protein
VQRNDTLEVHEGCYGNETCSGTVVLTFSDILFSCLPYTVTNTSSGNVNYAVCNYTYSGAFPLIVTGIHLLLLLTSLQTYLTLICL